MVKGVNGKGREGLTSPDFSIYPALQGFMMVISKGGRLGATGLLVLAVLIAVSSSARYPASGNAHEEEAATRTVIHYAEALRSRSRDQLLPYLTGEARQQVAQWPAFFGISNPHLENFEILHVTRVSDTQFEFLVRQHEEYTGYGRVGYYDETLVVVRRGGSYFISSIRASQYVDIGRASPGAARQ